MLNAIAPVRQPAPEELPVIQIHTRLLPALLSQPAKTAAAKHFITGLAIPQPVPLI